MTTEWFSQQMLKNDTSKEAFTPEGFITRQTPMTQPSQFNPGTAATNERNTKTS